MTNPLYVAYEGGTENRKSRTLNAIVEANFKIMEDLYLNGQYSANYYFRETDQFRPTLPEFDPNGVPDPDNEAMKNYVYQGHQDALTQSLQLTLNYKKTSRNMNLELCWDTPKSGMTIASWMEAARIFY